MVNKKKINGSDAIAFTNSYIQNWWNPPAKATFIEGSDTFKIKKDTYISAMNIYTTIT